MPAQRDPRRRPHFARSIAGAAHHSGRAEQLSPGGDVDPPVPQLSGEAAPRVGHVGDVIGRPSELLDFPGGRSLVSRASGRAAAEAIVGTARLPLWEGFYDRAATNQLITTLVTA